MPLLELEEGRTDAAVAEFQHQFATRPFPRLLGLPDVFVLIRRRVIAQPAAARRGGFLNRINAARCAGNGFRLRIADREDGHPQIAAQAELHRNGLSRVDCVDRRRVVNRLEETGEGVGRWVAGVADAIRVRILLTRIGRRGAVGG